MLALCWQKQQLFPHRICGHEKKGNKMEFQQYIFLYSYKYMCVCVWVKICVFYKIRLVFIFSLCPFTNKRTKLLITLYLLVKFDCYLLYTYGDIYFVYIGIQSRNPEQESVWNSWFSHAVEEVTMSCIPTNWGANVWKVFYYLITDTLQKLNCTGKKTMYWVQIKYSVCTWWRNNVLLGILTKYSTSQNVLEQSSK